MFDMTQGIQDETKKKIIEMLEKLAGTAGQAAEHLWGAACQAIYARGVAGLIADCLGIVLTIVIWTLVNKKVGSLFPEEREARVAVFCLTSLISLIALGMLISGIADNLPDIIAPEGQAVFKILGK